MTGPDNPSPASDSTAPAKPRRRRMTGVGRVLVIVYAILAVGAFGRSLVQIIERFDKAPLAFTLSAVSAVVYIVATLALVFAGSKVWYRIAWVTISFEMAGVLIIGTLSVIRPDLFPEATVWSFYGMGYVFVPLVLPFLGMWWLVKHPPLDDSTGSTDAGPVAQ
jgi:MFS family permease